MRSLKTLAPSILASTALVVAILLCCLGPVRAAESTALADVPPLAVENADATDEAGMEPYVEVVEHTEARIEMVPIPGGTFVMGSPTDEPDRKEDEGPQHKVQIDPFWMSKCEITWDAFDVWTYDLDIQLRKFNNVEANERDALADEYQLSQPTEPYTDMTFGMGKRGYPAICMTQLAARTFCQWLSAKTGRYYRLPTEAEWEYACRAGTNTAFSFGDDPDELDEYAWYYDNSDEGYQKVGTKKPNPWGLHDMHGNVSEWVLDQYTTDFYGKSAEAENPLAIPTTLYPRVVRGGSYDDDPEALRSAARMYSDPDWKMQDPQIPQSIWYHTDATFVGFRVVRPLKRPTEQELQNKWDKSEPVQDRKAGR
jgi:formylglycine-generating enzyme required for sulfatase activity